jgi:trehalose synthase
VGHDRPSELSDTAWRFLRDDLVAAEALIFSRIEYAPAWVDPARLFVISPSVDPLSAKNRALSAATVTAVLATTGLVVGADPAGATFVRADGTVGTIRSPRRPLVLDGPPPPHDAPLVVQVSRWDRLKDMPGVMSAFALLLERPGTDLMHLMLAGPATTGVGDDPEGAGVLDECRTAWRALPPTVRERTHLVEIPVDDVDENAIVVNALQRHAFAVVQKSLEEGFGLTVTEAMWKGRAVVASRVGGIQDQIVHGRDGLLLDDPRDLGSCAAALARLVDEPGLAERLGASARTRVLDDFLIDRHLEAYVELLSRLAAAEPSAAAVHPGT